MKPIIATWLLLVLALPLTAAEWFVATNGAPGGQGSQTAPWDMVSALGGKQKTGPGDVITLLPGTYKHPFVNTGKGFVIKLAGRESAPIIVRGLPGQRITIDGGLDVQPPATHLWIRDLEILVSEPRPDQPLPPDGTYQNVNRPWGGLNVSSGDQCKFINLIIHDNSQGVSWWRGSSNSELHGCIIYDNGWAGTDRGHGHAIYTQNQDGTKTISDCIMTGGFGYTLHAYGSKAAYVDHYLAEGNICYQAGTFLIGGGRPSHDIRVLSNHLWGVSMQVGYTAPTNEDCVVRGNLIVNGGLSINKFARVEQNDNRILNRNSPRPKGLEVVLRRNKYDPRRAHLAIFNWDKQPEVAVDFTGFLERGAKYRLLDPRNCYGRPVQTGTFSGAPIKVPVAGEFGAFVVLNE